MKIKLVFLIILAFILVFVPKTSIAYADELSDNIKEQLNNLDLSALDDYYLSLDNSSNNSVYTLITDILNGKFNEGSENFFNYVIKNAFAYFSQYAPTIVAVLAIIIIASIINNLRSNFGGEGVANVINLICVLSAILLLSSCIVASYNNTKNTIDYIANLVEIMSPIMLSLMVAVGGKVSASIYSPTVAFLTTIIINVILNVVIPLIIVSTIFSIISNFTQTIKLNKFSECANGIIKWIIGIVITIFTIFLSIQGIASATIDGVSIKAAKYAISNSVPIVGGFLRDGFDVFVAGSVLIKNSIGIASVIALLYTIISPILNMATLSILLKLAAGVGELFSEEKISNVCITLSKSLTYFIATTFIVALMVFILVLLIILSANAFI